MSYRVLEPELGNDLLAALRRPADSAALYAAAADAACEIERLRAIIQNVALAIGHNDSPLLLRSF